MLCLEFVIMISCYFWIVLFKIYDIYLAFPALPKKKTLDIFLDVIVRLVEANWFCLILLYR